MPSDALLEKDVVRAVERIRKSQGPKLRKNAKKSTMILSEDELVTHSNENHGNGPLRGCVVYLLLNVYHFLSSCRRALDMNSKNEPICVLFTRPMSAAVRMILPKELETVVEELRALYGLSEDDVERIPERII